MTQQDRKAGRLLVTGASGFLGWTLCRMAARQWSVYGAVCRHPVVPEGVRLCPVDLTDAGAVGELFASIEPDAVIHTAALSSPDVCQSHPEASEAVNVEASKHIAAACGERGIPFVYTSSDLVFDGEGAPYAEDSPAEPVSIYGEHKLRAEREMRTIYPGTIVCRLPLMFGLQGQGGKGYFIQMLQTMRAGKEVPLFTDETRTPVSSETASFGLLLALKRASGTTWHLGGPEAVSRWEFGNLAAEVFFTGKPRLTPCRQKDVDLPAPRPRNVSLDSSRAKGMGYLPKPLREQLCEIRNTLGGALFPNVA